MTTMQQGGAAGSAVEGSAVPDHAYEHANAQPSRRARAREAAAYLRGLLLALWVCRGKLTDAEKAAPSIRRESIWRQALPTIHDLLVAIRAGLMVPGDWPKPVELVGKAYGYGVALPVSLVALSVAWTAQRPARLLGIAVFVVLLTASL